MTEGSGPKALVTGAAGFIGSFLVERLLREGYEVAGVDDLSRGSLRNLEQIQASEQSRFHFYRADAAGQLPKDAMDGASVIFHYAAINGTQHFYDRPLDVLRVNFEALANVTDAALRSSTVERVVFSSSSEVYGEPSVVPTDEDEPCVVPDTSNPRNSYALSKMAGENYLLSAARKHGLGYLIFRIFNTYGPRMDSSGYGQVIPEFIRKALLDREFTVIGDGSQTRSFCFIEDHIELTWRAYRSARDGVLNLGNAQETSVGELARRILRLAGRSTDYRCLPAREGDIRRRVPDTRRIEAATGFRTKVPLAVGLERTFSWYAERLRSIPAEVFVVPAAG